MNIVSTILQKEFLSPETFINALWTSTDNQYFIKFISKINNLNLININDLYYGDINIHLIICNNKLTHADLAKDLSLRFHVPVLVIDHNVKNNLLDQKKINILNDFPCAYHVCSNRQVYESWGSYHNQILSYDINDKKSIDAWSNLIYNTSKRLFTIYE